jgi:hypothetical protein
MNARYFIRGIPGIWSVWKDVYTNTDEKGREFTMMKRVSGYYFRRSSAERRLRWHQERRR